LKDEFYCFVKPKIHFSYKLPDGVKVRIQSPMGDKFREVMDNFVIDQVQNHIDFVVGHPDEFWEIVRNAGKKTPIQTALPFG